MTKAKPPAASARRAGQAEFDRVTNVMRRQLASAPERPAVRSRHIGALLAFGRTQHLGPALMRIAFEHGGTAQWAARVMDDRDVQVSAARAGSGTLLIRRPHRTLGSYGYRDERWVFGLGLDAALGISRGAVHGAGFFTREGLSITCPSPAMMLTLYAVMGRLGIEAKLPRGWRGVIISSGDVPAALDLLGIAGAGDAYRRLLTDSRRAA